jgi:hypothetical protein
MIERIDRLTAPPKVGRFYLVPTVYAIWHDLRSDWPVIGPLHTDVEFFDFKHDHYHLDWRFLSARQRSQASTWRESPAADVQAAPLHAYIGEPELPKPVWTKRRCNRLDAPYEHGDKKPIKDLREHFSGVQCERGKAGWICPHRKASLGSVAIVDGVITCPLHGLRIDAATGLTLPRHELGGSKS